VRHLAFEATEAIAPVLALLAEGAWISVFAAFLQAAAHEPAWLGPAGYALLAGLGWIAARRSSPGGWRLAVAAPLLVIVGAIVGWLASGDVVSLIRAGTLETAAAHHPAGWLGGLAVLRGIAHGRSSSSESALGWLVGVGAPVLALPLLVGGFIPEPGRSAFFAQATPATVIFLVSATLGLAVRRMASVALRSGFDWRRNRAWLVLVSMLVGLVTLLAVPSSGTVAFAIQVLVGLTLVPAFILGLIASIVQMTRRTLVNLGVILAMGVVLLVLVQGTTIRPIAPSVPVHGGEGPIDNSGLYLAMAVGILIALAVVVVLLVWLWTRQSASLRDADLLEERVIDRGETAQRRLFHLRRPMWRIGSPPEPTSAAAAYLALLRDLNPLGELNREPFETPMGHARRLRSAGLGGIALDLLAADYQLECWAERRLSPAEDLRGVQRWRRLRADLRRARTGIEEAHRPADASAEGLHRAGEEPRERRPS
jgi:hypothetical protein